MALSRQAKRLRELEGQAQPTSKKAAKAAEKAAVQAATARAAAEKATTARAAAEKAAAELEAAEKAAAEKAAAELEAEAEELTGPASDRPSKRDRKPPKRPRFVYVPAKSEKKAPAKPALPQQRGSSMTARLMTKNLAPLPDDDTPGVLPGAAARPRF
jgi:hypothetical protein